MSYFTIEQPTITERSGPMDGVELNHPAYAQIGAYRSSGHTVLYGSEFNHEHYVSIRIKTSTHIRSLSNDWHHGKRELIEIAMSEAQWASFVSGMNVGDGPCCTLKYLNGERVAQPPAPQISTEHFRKEIAQVFEEACQSLAAVKERLGSAIGKREAAELQKIIENVSRRIVGSSGFVADKFDEHMENTTEKAKIEVNAFVESTIRRAGLDAIAGDKVLTIADTKGGAA